MTKIKLWLWGFLSTLTLLWLIAVEWSETSGFSSLIVTARYFTGVLAIGAMSFAMILALRPVWLEPWLGGLDKTYRLHKWLGISALVMSVAHWLVVNAPKWAVGFGLIERPERGSPPAEAADLGTIQTLFNSQRGTSETVGEWAFYAAILLIALALIKWFPYRWFAKTHTLIAVVYLALVFHAVVLMDFTYWTQPVGILSGLLMASGVIAAVLALTGRIGHNRKVEGTLDRIDIFKEIGIMETTIRMADGWQGHEAGQFAFVTFDPKEGAHPFTIGSAWNPVDPHISFITKGLGDFTRGMAEHLKVGDKASVEGPYGRFIFADGNKRQIWIGGGIGITPFIARMKQLSQAPHDMEIDLYHAIPFEHPGAGDKIAADVQASNVRLHVNVDTRHGFLTGARLREEIPDWKSASIWFCGPAKFGDDLKKDLVANGLAKSDFHQELFNMR